jgi:dihydrofolate reductase
VAGLFISVDGVTESPNKWQFDNFDADMAAAMSAHIAAEDAILLGRITYQEWAPYWPTSTDEPYASHINNTPKFVVTNTLEKVAWKNSTLVRPGALRQTIAELKQRAGKNIGVAGSPTLVGSLLRDDLLDELILMIHPVVAGNGKRLFRDGEGLKRLRLVTSHPTGTGVLIATYTARG